MAVFMRGEPKTWPLAGETVFTTGNDQHKREVVICGHLNSLNGSTPMIAYKIWRRGQSMIWFDTIENFLASSSKVP